ncbi:TPA: GhoT/OrtT family toxin [Salmonella enterica subsp. enterica serovar Newport]
MSLYQEMLLVYNVMAILSGLIIWFISYEKKSIRLLSALLIGITWPMSFPVALLFSLL